MIEFSNLKKFSIPMGVREDIVMASMDAVLSCMNVLTTDYNNKNQITTKVF